MKFIYFENRSDSKGKVQLLIKFAEYSWPIQFVCMKQLTWSKIYKTDIRLAEFFAENDLFNQLCVHTKELLTKKEWKTSENRKNHDFLPCQIQMKKFTR